MRTGLVPAASEPIRKSGDYLPKSGSHNLDINYYLD
jgi:hypothetical protein